MRGQQNIKKNTWANQINTLTNITSWNSTGSFGAAALPLHHSPGPTTQNIHTRPLTYVDELLCHRLHKCRASIFSNFNNFNFIDTQFPFIR